MTNIIIDNDFKKEVIDILKKANKAILNVYSNSDFDIKLKDDNSPLTEADLSAHQTISTRLKEINPKIPIVSEEDTNSTYLAKNSEFYWLLDPLDGTKEFIKRSGEFTCNIALIKNSQPLYGFVGVPASGTIFHGGKNKDSFKITTKSNQTQINCSPQKKTNKNNNEQKSY